MDEISTLTPPPGPKHHQLAVLMEIRGVGLALIRAPLASLFHLQPFSNFHGDFIRQ